MPHPGREPVPDSSGSEAKLISVTAFLQTAATVIPVLLVAGLLNPRLLREYSKTKGSAKSAKRFIAIAVVSTVVCVYGVYIVETKPDLDDQFFVQLSLAFVAALGLGAAVGPIFLVAQVALDLDPHPQRLETERDDLERALRLKNAQIAEVRSRSGDDGGEDDR